MFRGDRPLAAGDNLPRSMGGPDQIPLARPDIGAREEEIVLDVLRAGRLSLGPMVERFERAVDEAGDRGEVLVGGGRLVVPVGGPRSQRLEVIVRSPEGPAVIHSVPCRFVPLVGAEGYAE